MKATQIQVGDVVIDEVELKEVTEEEIVAFNTFSNLMRAEANPEDPPRPVELTRAYIRNIPEFISVREFVARDAAGTMVATAEVSVSRTDDNKHIVEAGVSVHPDMRRRGIAKALLGLIAGVAQEEGRTLLLGGTSERVPAGEAFARRINADLGSSTHTNRLMLSDLDTASMRTWIEEGPSRAQGYSLITIDGPYPDDMLDAMVEVNKIMNDAPRDDIDMEDWVITAEHVRSWEKTMLATGDERWSLVARHDATGELVGFTEMLWNSKVPKVAYQMGTGVRPDHRGHALGKWLKAVMLQRLLDERHEVDQVRTGNADSNDAMLGINKQLGFKPFQAHSIWQVSLDKVLAYLSS